MGGPSGTIKGMKRLIHWLKRAGETVQNPFSARPYLRPQRGDAANDFTRLTGDMRKVGNDLRKVSRRELRQYGW